MQPVQLPNISIQCYHKDNKEKSIYDTHLYSDRKKDSRLLNCLFYSILSTTFESLQKNFSSISTENINLNLGFSVLGRGMSFISYSLVFFAMKNFVQIIISYNKKDSKINSLDMKLKRTCEDIIQVNELIKSDTKNKEYYENILKILKFQEKTFQSLESELQKSGKLT